MKFTRWFPASVKPVREGWYECQYFGDTETGMRYWAGDHWRLTPRGSFGTCAFTWHKKDRWRGVAK